MEQLKGKTVLVFGEDNRSFLAVVRSLSQAGMEVDSVSFSKLAPALTSKYIKNKYFFNHLSMTLAEWKNEVVQLLNEKNYDLIIPCDERSLFPLIELKKITTCSSIFAVPEEHNLGPLFDKVLTRQTATKCDISVAGGELLDLNEMEFTSLVSQFNLPLVLKPTQSYVEENLSKRQDVQIAYDESSFRTFVKHNGESKCLVESYFSGYGVGVSILASEGVINTAFAHAREAEPETGGGSSYRKSIPLNQDMLSACKRFCLELNYTGVAMFEFKYNPTTGEWILLEVNSRFWGSLPLAIFAGVDFPAKYAALLLNNTIIEQFSYKEGVYARSFAADVYAMKSEFDVQRSRKGALKAFGGLIKRLSSLSRIVIGKESIDSFQWGDQKPFYQELYALFSDKINLLPLIKDKNQRKRVDNFKSKLKVTSGDKSQEVLFICYGNIMRSPFAANLFQKKIQNTSLMDLNVDSFGFHQVVARKALPECVSMAQSWQVDLSEHESKLITRTKIAEDNPIAIIFDLKNEMILRSYYPEVNFISLADLIPSDKGFHIEIEDPYGKPSDEIKFCYQLIDSGLDELIKLLSQNTRKAS